MAETTQERISIIANAEVPRGTLIVVGHPSEETVRREKLPGEDYEEFLVRTNRIGVIKNLAEETSNS